MHPGNRDLELHLTIPPDQVLLSVRVTDDAGRPIRDGRLIVNVVGDDDSTNVNVAGKLVRVLLAAPADRVILSLYGAHDLDGEPLGRSVAGPFPVTSEPIPLQLPKGRNLVGRVVTADGVGVPHVSIDAYQLAPWFNFRGRSHLPVADPCRPEVPEQDDRGVDSGGPHGHARVEDRG